MADRLLKDIEPIASSRAAARSAGPSIPQDFGLIVSQFDPSARGKIRRLIAQSPRAGDLLNTFPGAAYVLATGCRPPCAIKQTMNLVEKGAPLKDVATALDLPLWLRRLPAEAFRGDLGKVPSTDRFARRIRNKLPKRKEQSSFWLETVCFAATAASDDFAVWLAGQHIYAEPEEPQYLFPVLCAYAWHSAHNTPARKLVVAPWRREMSLETAICAAKSWLNRLRLVVQIGNSSLTEPWLEAGTSGEFTFCPLMTASEILLEAQVMQNCADQYASRLAINRCRLYSVRRHSKPVATLEIAPHSREAAFLSINQLKASRNTRAPLDVWQAAYAWLATQPNLEHICPAHHFEMPCDMNKWTELLCDYRRAKAGAPWIPIIPNPDVFGLLDCGVADLARRSGVTSWLFT